MKAGRGRAWVMSVLACGTLAAALVAGCGSENVASRAVAPAGRERPTDRTRIVLGSCLDQTRPAPILAAIRVSRPDILLLLGDNVYADTRDRAELEQAYARQLARPEFAQILRDVPRWFATWDDHDYGENDAGSEYPLRRESQQVFLDFVGATAGSARRAREGVYHAEVLGEEPRRVQIIMLDTRYHRSALVRVDERLPGRGPYRAENADEATILGEAQWAWLRQQLRVPAEVRVIASSIQFVANEHGFECWGNLPREQTRLVGALREAGAQGAIVVSGDRHHGELSCLPAQESGLTFPLFDLTSSSLNRGRGAVAEPNSHRVGAVHGQPNFGVIDILWSDRGARVVFELRGTDGGLLETHDVPLADLGPPR